MTPKQTALNLLAQATLDDDDLFALTCATAEYVGYTVKPTRDVGLGITVYALFKGDAHIEGDTVDIDSLWCAVPQYAESVDACLSLPNEGMVWMLSTDGTPDGCTVEMWHIDSVNRVVYKTGATLPLAMLKAWWTMQGANDDE